jgi:hypothetical protein
MVAPTPDEMAPNAHAASGIIVAFSINNMPEQVNPGTDHSKHGAQEEPHAVAKLAEHALAFLSSHFQHGNYAQDNDSQHNAKHIPEHRAAAHRLALLLRHLLRGRGVVALARPNSKTARQLQ